MQKEPVHLFFSWLNLCKISARCNGFATVLNGPSIHVNDLEYGLFVQTMAFMGLNIARSRGTSGSSVGGAAGCSAHRPTFERRLVRGFPTGNSSPLNNFRYLPLVRGVTKVMQRACRLRNRRILVISKKTRCLFYM